MTIIYYLMPHNNILVNHGFGAKIYSLDFFLAEASRQNIQVQETKNILEIHGIKNIIKEKEIEQDLK